MRTTVRVLMVLGLGGLWLAVVFVVVPWPVPTAWFFAATAPTWVWIADTSLVVRPRLREIERQQASWNDPFPLPVDLVHRLRATT
jgi:hypothetical protein